VIAAYLSFAAAVAVLIASPGPVIALVLAEGRRAWPAWTIAGGVLSAQLLLVAALIAIYLALDISPSMLNWGQVLGGFYLTLLGMKTLGGGAEQHEVRTRNAHSFWKAMGVGLSNPKDILFFLAFLPGFIQHSAPFAPQAITLLLIWATIDITILVAYSLVARRIAGSLVLSRLLDLLPGFVLVGIGMFSLTMGMARLLN
jgi:threonine/homoserine/homoserine lactone efflux protein